VLARGRDIVAGGKLLQHLDIGDQAGAGESPLEQIVTEERVVRLAAIERVNAAKAQALYAEIDRSGFYRNPVRKEDRSRVSVPFVLRDDSLNDAFLDGAKQRGLTQLKGHRAVGGMRASLYNAMPQAGVDALVAWMREFERVHG